MFADKSLRHGEKASKSGNRVSVGGCSDDKGFIKGKTNTSENWEDSLREVSCREQYTSREQSEAFVISFNDKSCV